MKRSTYLNALVALASVAGLLTAGIGALHIPQVQAFLGASCPIPSAGETVGPVERQVRRERANALIRGEGHVVARAAGEFVLLRSTKSDIESSAARAKWSCGPGKSQVGLRCSKQRDAVSLVRFYDFDPQERLVATTFLEYHEDARTAVRSLQDQHDAVVRIAGAADELAGKASAEYLQAGTWRQARRAFVRSDYYASLSATHVAPEKYLVTSQFVGIP